MAQPEPDGPPCICVYTHNVLADTWVGLPAATAAAGGKTFYHGIDPALLDGATRRAICFKAIAANKPDVVCLQEVGHTEVRALWASTLAAEYYITAYAENPGSVAAEPNGIITLLRRETMGVSHTASCHHQDAAAAVAAGTFSVSVVRCKHVPSGRQLLVANSHVDHGAHGVHQVKYTQELLDSMTTPDDKLVLWCGDFNATPHQDGILAARGAGFNDALGFDETKATYCGADAAKKRIDYILYKTPNAAAAAAPDDKPTTGSPGSASFVDTDGDKSTLTLVEGRVTWTVNGEIYHEGITKLTFDSTRGALLTPEHELLVAVLVEPAAGPDRQKLFADIAAMANAGGVQLTGFPGSVVVNTALVGLADDVYVQDCAQVLLAAGSDHVALCASFVGV